jgi:hypothetical protein
MLSAVGSVEAGHPSSLGGRWATARPRAAHFTRRADDGFDGFEVWDGSRRLYCYPGETEDPPKET